MRQRTKDKAKGKFHEVKGKIKEKVGRATNNPDLEAEGQVEKIGGKVQRKIGQVEKVLGNSGYGFGRRERTSTGCGCDFRVHGSTRRDAGR